MTKTLHRRLLDIARAQDDVTHSNEKGRAYERECRQAIKVRDARVSSLEHDVQAQREALQELADASAAYMCRPVPDGEARLLRVLHAIETARAALAALDPGDA